MESQGIAQNIDEKKVNVFFITIEIVIPTIQLLTQNINTELRLWDIVEHLRWNVFAEKLHRSV